MTDRPRVPKVGDIAETLNDFCEKHELKPQEAYVWICCQGAQKSCGAAVAKMFRKESRSVRTNNMARTNRTGPTTSEAPGSLSSDARPLLRSSSSVACRAHPLRTRCVRRRAPSRVAMSRGDLEVCASTNTGCTRPPAGVMWCPSSSSNGPLGRALDRRNVENGGGEGEGWLGWHGRAWEGMGWRMVGRWNVCIVSC